MLFYYSWEKWTYDEFGMDSYIAMTPGILYTVAVIITSQLWVFNFLNFDDILIFSPEKIVQILSRTSESKL